MTWTLTSQKSKSCFKRKQLTHSKLFQKKKKHDQLSIWPACKPKLSSRSSSASSGASPCTWAVAKAPSAPGRSVGGCLGVDEIFQESKLYNFLLYFWRASQTILQYLAIKIPSLTPWHKARKCFHRKSQATGHPKCCMCCSIWLKPHSAESLHAHALCFFSPLVGFWSLTLTFVRPSLVFPFLLGKSPHKKMCWLFPWRSNTGSAVLCFCLSLVSDG